MPGPSFHFDAELWRWDGPAAWMFVSLPEPIADEIADHVEGQPRAGFGSVKVEVRVGGSRWTTSVFPDSTRGTYLLPIKKSVRLAEEVDEGDVLTIDLAVM